ncbi:MAG: Lrp/AsnC family transcriptional regulator [Pseudomonadota bacterium]
MEVIITTLDRQDRAILRALQKDGRLSIQDLSEQVNLSASPCSRRIKRLEETGVILGYKAHLDERKTGAGFSVFVSVRLDRQVDEALQAFEAAIASYDEVVDCWLMTGQQDYLMRVAVADLDEFETFLTGRLTKLSSVAAIESSIPIRAVKKGFSRAP